MKRRPFFPRAVSVAGAALVTEGDGCKVPYLATYGRGALVGVYRVPDLCKITLQAPSPLPSAQYWRGARVTFQTAEARQVLRVNTLRLYHELKDVLDAYDKQLQLDRATLAAAQHKVGAA